jgi:DNA-binding XRE family transcriptional regulator
MEVSAGVDEELVLRGARSLRPCLQDNDDYRNCKLTIRQLKGGEQMMLTPKVAKGLRECRLSAGMTQQQLADVLMIDKSYVSKIENGHAVPDAELYNNWIAVTKGPVFMFRFVFGGADGSKVLQSS